MNIIQLKYSS